MPSWIFLGKEERGGVNHPVLYKARAESPRKVRQDFAPVDSLFYTAKLIYFFHHNIASKIRILIQFLFLYFVCLFLLTFLGFLLWGTDEGDQSG